MGSVDIFTPIHKGLRKAMFDMCLRLGRAEQGEPGAWSDARQHAIDVLRFLDHHTVAENTLLLPMLAPRAPLYFERMMKTHAELDAARDALDSALRGDGESPYALACSFTAAQLTHMHEEELTHLPVIQIHLSADELLDFERRASTVAPEADRAMMLRYVAEALNAAELHALLSKIGGALPANVVADLKAVAAAARR